MYADKESDITLTNVEISQIPSYHQIQILNSLRTNLGEFALMCRNTLKPETASDEENYITKQIGRFLTSKNNGYLFEPESQCGPDLQVIIFKTFNLHEPPIFVIETKRLRKRSGRDYVQGETGGIERFKREKHGEMFGIAAMLGYVEEEDFLYWHEKVNSWIDVLINSEESEIIWDKNDQLIEIAISEIGEYKSTHKRKRIQDIVLHHFWLNFCIN
jgi:hypothetical protein